MKIVGASMCELSRVPADKISINKIIKTAGISRGSFYQYFEDKSDLLDYILSNWKGRLQTCFKRNLEKYNGKLFEMTEAIYEEIILLGRDENNLKIMKNFLLGMKFTKNDRLNFMKLFDISESFLNDIFSPYVNQNNFRDVSENFVRVIIDVICLLMKQSFTDVFSDYENLEMYKKDFYIQLDIIRHGAIKE